MISFHTCPLASQEGKETGGMNVYVLELSKELAHEGHIVDIFTRSQDVDNPEIVNVTEGLRVIHLKAGPQTNVSKKQLGNYLHEFEEQMVQFIDTHHVRYDVLHCHYYYSGLIGLELQKRLPTPLPIVMMFHTLALMKNLVARTEAEKENSERVDAEFLLTKKVQKIIVPSENEMKYYQYLYGVQQNRLAVIPPGVDVHLFHPMSKKTAKQVIGADEDHKIILFVGRIEPLKGIDGLIYSMKILTQKHPNCQICLWIVGGDISQKQDRWSAELQKIEELRSLLHIPTVVKLVGQRPQIELPYYYNSAEVVVMPSHYESFGMAAAEAMACGVPVITTNVTGISSLFDERHKSLITSVNNPLLLASQIEHVLMNTKAHADISVEVQKKIQDLAWPEVAQQIVHVYREVIDF